jgi:ankyrin repeat protein
MLGRIAAGRTDLVFDWTATGGDPAATIEDASLIGWCAYYGDVSAIRHLLAHGVALRTLGTDLGLIGAAFHGHWRLCEYLIEQGADPRSTILETGETALHSALCKFESLAHERVVEVLLGAGAEVNARTNPGMETGGFMRDTRTRGETALHRAAAYGTANVIRLMIGAGATLDATDANGDTPLGWGSWALREAPVLHLLCFGAYKVNPGRPTMAANLIGGPRKE